MTNEYIKSFVREHTSHDFDVDGMGLLSNDYAGCFAFITCDGRAVYNYEKICLRYAFLHHIPYEDVRDDIMPSIVVQLQSRVKGTVPIFAIYFDGRKFSSNQDVRVFLKNDSCLIKYSDTELLDEHATAVCGITLDGKALYAYTDILKDYIVDNNLSHFGREESAAMDTYAKGVCCDKNVIIVDLVRFINAH